ncbi:type II toxin-antitoxin system RelE/ParE family toxin [Achromobacter ruhlandii]|uniref:Type II toxin-antitoxin system RelE/ParE family toxin n=1 Tax=Achromobacter ruhlandii TaxID=72557 RepID=A0ABM8LV72_9BURK|nr:type II toxin-antitoxin system RelE/ParE family toxin [Achromobacter ruhlandii]AKP91461.1 plasmid stabilization system [Achromobacter xylosoxidans]MCZ8434707.1 type II toxin-antitoxin system RelE/ParE family toxin [Achromobacter ruhlandii]MDC6089857.1 type II toxin-antitoxin system RelE/ParE family toxin [Achromobacter ruhlandii]MDC6153952.1 type II toxin-antitoxin system RelE/ParE family toxin [Achromobacter ruhlandii]MDD7981617.1 type II toxin-antitoxin system RelE/ParE family toxin [Achr
MFRVVFTPDALRDIVNMQRYFSPAGTSATADGYVDGVIQACLDLAHFPRRGARRHAANPNLRFLHHQKRCTIAYSVNDDGSVTIMGVFYGGRDYSHLLHEPARPYRLRTHRKLAAIPSPGLGWSYGQTMRRRKASGAGSSRRLNLASDSGAHREESC